MRRSAMGAGRRPLAGQSGRLMVSGRQLARAQRRALRAADRGDIVSARRLLSEARAAAGNLAGHRVVRARLYAVCALERTLIEAPARVRQGAALRKTNRRLPRRERRRRYGRGGRLPRERRGIDGLNYAAARLRSIARSAVWAH